MNHNLKEKMLGDYYEYSQTDIAEKLFLALGTVASDEKKGIEKIKQALAQRNIKSIEDLI